VVVALLIGPPALQATSRTRMTTSRASMHAGETRNRATSDAGRRLGLLLMLAVGAGLLSTSLMRLYRTGIDLSVGLNIALRTTSGAPG
jgi:hypothetical protein